MRIGELAKISGVAAHTIRFYETKGLLPKASRGVNGYRTYDENSVEHLTRIQCAKRLGFSLENILIAFAKQGTTDNLDHVNVLAQLDNRLTEVQSLIKGLSAQRDEIILFKQQLQQSWDQGKCMPTKNIVSQSTTTITKISL